MSRKFITGDGGFHRIVWMPRRLKDELRETLDARAREEGIEGFVDMVADETNAQTEEEVFERLQQVNHPALTMDPMF